MDDERKSQYRQLARELAADSIVIDALARLIEQVVAETRHVVRAAVIEECASVADDECERNAGINADRYWQSRRIRDAIRALKEPG